MPRSGHRRRYIRPFRKVVAVAGNAFDIVIPCRCILCGEIVACGQAFCCNCETELPFNEACCARCAATIHSGELCGDCLRSPPPFDLAFAPLLYCYPLDRLIQQLKYAEDPAMGRILGGYIARELIATRSIPLPDMILPVALHRDRLRERGYNQALEICRAITRITGIPVDAELISRQRPTPPQVGKSKKNRQQNMRNAFRLERQPHRDHYAIVDDVITSGATMRAIARLLREAGVDTIEIWSIARA